MKKTLLLVVIAVAMAFGITACGGSTSSSSTANTANTSAKTEAAKTVPAIVGAWECTGIDLAMSGEYMDSAQYKELTGSELKDYMTIQAWENGNAVVTMGADADSTDMLVLQWTESSGTFEMALGEGSGEKYRCEIGDDKEMKLTVSISYTATEGDSKATVVDEMAMKFKRTGDPDMTSIYSLNFNYTNAQTQSMSALIAGGYYLMDGNTVYGNYSGDKIAKVEVKKEGSSPKKVSESVLKEGETAYTMTKKGDVLYYIGETNDKATGIYSYDLSSGKETELVKGEVDYLSVTDSYLFYTDSSYQIYRADLTGKNATKVSDDEAYYVYALSDNFLLYQDDADSETLVIYNIATKDKFEVSPAYSYEPVIANGYLYYVFKDGGSKYLGRTNLTTGEMEKGDYALDSSVFFISNNKLYLNDGFSVSLDKWNQLSSNIPAAYMSIYFNWVDDTYCIEEGFGASNLYCVDGDDGYVAMMTNDYWAKISQ